MYKEAYERISNDTTELQEKILEAIRNSISLTYGACDMRNCVVVLLPDGTLDTRMLGQNEYLRDTDVLINRAYSVAWEMLDDVRGMIRDNSEAQAAMIAAAKQSAEEMEDDGPVPEDWEGAYDYIGFVPENVKEMLAQEWVDWFLKEGCSDYMRDQVDAALEQLRELAREEDE